MGVRFMGFPTSMLVFPIMTYFYLGEPMTLKIVTLILSYYYNDIS